ncbi:MAG: MerR family transcriptional regulator [Myxococcota bacterium]
MSVITLNTAVPATLKIGDLARRVGKSPRALRLYEEMGLLGPAVRSEGGHRLYAQDALLRLRWIDRLQLLGLSLPDIRDFLKELEGAESGPRAMGRVRSLFIEKMHDVDRQLRELTGLREELRDGLAYLDVCSECSSESDVGGCRNCGRRHSAAEPVLISGIHYKGQRNNP